MSSTITCVIPFYNEGKRLTHTLNKLRSVTAIDNIILVNDGSTQPLPIIPLPQTRYQLISLPQNLGKTPAVKHAIPSINTPLTLLFDADLHDFMPTQIQSVLNHVKTKPADMLIFRQTNDPWYCKLAGFDLCMSGERLIKTHHLTSLYPRLTKAYTLETTLNAYFANSHYQVGWVSFQSNNYRKLQKWPAKTALAKTFSLYKHLLHPHNLKTHWQSYQYFKSKQMY